MSVVIKQKNPGWLKKLLQRYENDAVLAVGYPATETGGIKYPDGTSVIMVAAVNNFGANIQHPGGTSYVIRDGKAQFVSSSFVGPVHGITGAHQIDIPARPFMTDGAQPALEATTPIAEALIPAINAGKATPEQVLEKMGPFAAAAFRQTITEGAWEPNSSATERRKGSSKPLIDTGLMRNSLTYAVRKGK